MRILLLIFLLGAGPAVVYGQANDKEPAFPTYKQIRNPPADIYDIPTRAGQPSMQNQPMRIQLFDYPSRTVNYIINGKPTDNATKAKKLVSKPGNQIENIYIGAPDATGKRIIKFDFLPKRE